ncbi:hypothetical protein AX16_002404 [Volvariella volvacea WC 439]|nr:hypothetical protein AX16_002404 [Volvariella volvacea WC 439]
MPPSCLYLLIRAYISPHRLQSLFCQVQGKMINRPPDLSGWVERYPDNPVRQAVESSNYPIFEALLAAGYDPNEVPWYSGNIKTSKRPLHVAAANPNHLFLRKLLESGARTDVLWRNHGEELSAFKIAMNEGQWDNAMILLTSGGNPDDSEDKEALWEQKLASFGLDDEENSSGSFFLPLFGLLDDDLVDISLPSSYLDARKVYARTFPYDTPYYRNDYDGEYTHLELLITTRRGLDNERRQNLIREYIRAGGDVSRYQASSPLEVWNIRAQALHAMRAMSVDEMLGSLPLEDLGVSYHTSLTPLHLCVITSNEELLRFLITEVHLNPDIPEFTSRGATPLLLAIRRRSMPIARALLELGASIDFTTPIMRLTALHFAASTRDVSIVRWVIEEILRQKDEESARSYLNQRTLFGHTALHLACMPSAGDLYTDKGRVSIHYQIFEYNDTNLRLELVELLQAVGAVDWTAQDHQGNTPGHYLMMVNFDQSTAEGAENGRRLRELAMQEAAGIKNEFGYTVADLWE